jgi:ATP-dependent RNA helicase RhlE
MPQERHEARKLERELKIKFEWREADKNLEKEVRNQPLDITAPGVDILQLESRSWKANDSATPTSAPNGNYRRNRNGFRHSSNGGFSGGRNSGGRGSNNRPGNNRHGNNRPGNHHRPNGQPSGSSHSGPARHGQ